MRTLLALAPGAAASAAPARSPNRAGTGDLGVVIERAPGTLADRRHQRAHAARPKCRGWATCRTPRSSSRATAATPTCSGATAALTKVDLLRAAHRAARACRPATRIGGAISQDGRWSRRRTTRRAASRCSTRDTLELLADIPATLRRRRQASRKVVGLADAPGNRFVFSLFEAGEIWIADLSMPRAAEADEVRERRQAALRRAGHARRPPLHRRPVRRGRPRAARPVASGARGAAHPRRLRPRRGAAAGVQDAAPARLGDGRAPRLPAGGRPPRGAGGRHRHLDAKSARIAGRRPAGVRDGAARRAPGLGQLRVPGQRQGAGHRHRDAQVVQDARARQGGAAHGVHAARRGGLDLARATTTA